MKMTRMIPYVILVLLLMVMLMAGCDVLNGKTTEEPAPVATTVASSERGVIVEGRVVPKEDSELFFLSGGEVSEVLVSEGQQVTRGQVLARLGDRESYQASVAAAELELTLAQQAVDDLERTTSLAYQQARLDVTQAEAAKLDADERLEDIDTDDTQKKIDDANVKLSDKEDDLQDAQDEFDKYADLDADNTQRKNAEDKLKDAQTAYDQAERERDRLVNDLEQVRAEAALSNAHLQEAKYRLEQRTDGPDKDEMTAAEARLENAQAQLAAAEAALAKLNLVAPYDGKIVKINIAVGETALPNQTAMVIADLSAWYVETTDLTENEVVSIAVGQTALIVPDALPDLEMSAEMEKISETYQEIAGDITYTARLLLTDPDPRLRWGMTVEVTFSEK
jgi:multidrug efflux pump subunit AcrA (membrane-fusion protein)